MRPQKASALFFARTGPWCQFVPQWKKRVGLEARSHTLAQTHNNRDGRNFSTRPALFKECRDIFDDPASGAERDRGGAGWGGGSLGWEKPRRAHSPYIART